MYYNRKILFFNGVCYLPMLRKKLSNWQHLLVRIARLALHSCLQIRFSPYSILPRSSGTSRFKMCKKKDCNNCRLCGSKYICTYFNYVLTDVHGFGKSIFVSHSVETPQSLPISITLLMTFENTFRVIATLSSPINCAAQFNLCLTRPR